MTKVIGGKIPEKEHRKLKVEDAVDQVLDKMIFAKRLEAKDVRKDCLFLPHEMGPMWMRAPDDDDRIFFAPEEVNSPELVWPVSTGMAWTKIDETGFPTVQCNYWESVPAKRLRGRYRLSGKHNLAFYCGQFVEDLKFISAVEYATWSIGRWRTSQRIKYDDAFIDGVRFSGMAPIARYLDKGEDDIGAICAMGQSIALTYRYEWGAQFSIEGSARVIIPTTPRGILELFNDRDKPADRDRRAALRHWVRQHRRVGRKGDFSAVRGHLRGQTKFQWRGFDVTIVPSRYDDEQNKTGTVETAPAKVETAGETDDKTTR